jgi:alkylation response protein AidB-like acyl-CoA dehydrogenase
MAGQFELGTKHLECMKLASQNLSEAGNSVSAMLQKTYGQLPSESQVYDDYLGLTVAIEEIAKTSPETASVLSDQVVIREIFKAYGNSNAAAILESGSTLGILCSEPGMSSVSTITTKATRNNGEWTINGIKQICNEQLSADNYVIFAQDEEDVIRLFVVSKSQITVNTVNKQIASAKVSLCQANINVTLSESSHVGDVTDEFEFVQTVARTLVAATSVGIAHSALLASISVGKEVKNSQGQALSQSQNIQFTLADMFAEIEASRMLTYLSANSIDEKKASVKYATMAKVKASDIAAKSSVDALHLLGNIGYVANTDFANVIMRAVEGQVKGGTNRTQMSQIYQYMLAKK